MAKSGGSIGTLAGTVIGGVLGAIFAVPTFGLSLYAGLSLGAAVGGIVGGVAGTLFDTTTADDTLREQQGLADLSMQTSTYGQVIPQVFGSYGGISGNVIWTTPKIEHEHRQEESASAKGGGPKVVTVTRTYTVSMAIGICDTRVTGPVAFLAGISRDLTTIWYGAPGKSLPAGWTFYDGAQEHADPTMEAALGVGNVPAFRHLCYVVIKDDDLGMSGRTFNYTFDVATDATASLAFGALRVQPGTGRPWLNVRPANEVWWVDPDTQATLGTTRVSGPELLGGFSGTYDAQLAVSAERVWATMGWFMFEFDGATGAELSSYRFEEHVAGGAVIFRDVPLTPIVERGSVALVLVQCHAGLADFSQRYDTDIVQMARGGGVVTRRLTDRRPTWLEAAPDGSVWAMAHRVELHPPSPGIREQTLYRLDPSSLASFSETDVAVGIVQTFHVAPSGHVWVPIYHESLVQRYSPGGLYEGQQTLAEYPFQCATASDGRLWVFCQGTPAEAPTTPGHLFRLDENSLEVLGHVRVDPTIIFFSTGLGGPTALDAQLIAGADGSVWCTSRINNTVSHVSASGAVQTFPTLALPITVQASITPGEVWVSSLQGGLQRFTDTGVVTPPATSSSRGGLPGVVRDLCGAAGLTPDQIDLSGLPSGTVSMALVSMQAVRAPLQDLAQAYRFYAVETAGRLAFRQVGSGAVVAEIPEGALDAAENVSPGDGLSVQRLDTQQLPTTLDITAPDQGQRYQSNTQRHFLGVGTDEVEAPRTVSVGLALLPVQAKQLAQELLSSLWVQRESFRTQVSRAYAYLEPGDRVTITARGLTYPVVLTQTGYGRPGLLELSGVQDAAYVRNAVGAAPPVVVPAPPVVPVVQSTLALMLNLPALHGADTTPRAHVAFIATAPGWSGAVLYRSRDGETYEAVLSSSLEAWSGVVGAATPAADWHVFDDTTQITVGMRSPEMQLRSVSDEALLNGANRCVLGSEILAFGQATLVGVQTYTVTRLLRGRRGTEHFVGAHLSNERMIMLDQAVHTVPLLPGETNSPRLYKVVSVGQTIDLVEPFSFTATAPNMLPWTATQPGIVQDGNDWILSWSMRSRLSPDWMQHQAGIAFDVDFRHFRVDIFSSAAFATVLRSTLTDGGTPMDGEARKVWRYENTMQIADFGAHQDTIHVRIYQVSNTGPGYPIDYSS